MIRSDLSRALVLAMLALLALPVSLLAEENAMESKPESSDDPALKEIDAFIEKQAIDKSDGGWKLKLAKPPKLSFEAKSAYKWHLETNQGPLVIKFMPEVAPMHVSSTIYLTRMGFYDDTAFHRVIPGFMAQGGDPLGSGSGGPGYEYDGEFPADFKHDRGGLLSMANRGPGTDGSQFFLTFAATPWLDGKHTLFGEVVGGKATLKKLEARGTRAGRPTEKLEIQKATITVE